MPKYSSSFVMAIPSIGVATMFGCVYLYSQHHQTISKYFVSDSLSSSGVGFGLSDYSAGNLSTITEKNSGTSNNDLSNLNSGTGTSNLNLNSSTGTSKNQTYQQLITKLLTDSFDKSNIDPSDLIKEISEILQKSGATATLSTDAQNNIVQLAQASNLIGNLEVDQNTQKSDLNSLTTNLSELKNATDTANKSISTLAFGINNYQTTQIEQQITTISSDLNKTKKDKKEAQEQEVKVTFAISSHQRKQKDEQRNLRKTTNKIKLLDNQNTAAQNGLNSNNGSAANIKAWTDQIAKNKIEKDALEQKSNEYNQKISAHKQKELVSKQEKQTKSAEIAALTNKEKQQTKTKAQLDEKKRIHLEAVGEHQKLQLKLQQLQQEEIDLMSKSSTTQSLIDDLMSKTHDQKQKLQELLKNILAAI